MLHLARTAAAIVAALTLIGQVVSAHEMTVMGTVAGIESTRIQVRTGQEKKDESPTWYPIGAKTKIMRGKNVVTFEQAKIVANERVVLIVDHRSDTDVLTLEIRLPAQATK